jgi:cardiolipin synthase
MLTDHLVGLIATLVALIHLSGALSAIHAVACVRTPQGAIAWAISLATFPWLALPLYWIFGRNRFHGYGETSHRGVPDPANQKALLRFQEQLRSFQVDLPPERAGDFVALTRLSKTPVHRGQCAGAAGGRRCDFRGDLRRTRRGQTLHFDRVLHDQGR